MVKLEDLFVVTPEQEIEVLKIYERNPITIQRDIDALKEWIQQQKHFPEFNFLNNDGRLRKLLINCKMSVEKAKSRIDMFYTSKSLLPDLFEGTEPAGKKMRELSQYICFYPLKHLTKNYERIYVHHVTREEAEFIDYNNVILYLINLANLTLHMEHAVLHSLIIDFKNCNFNMVKKMSPLVLKKALDVLSKTYGGRIGCAHLLNCPNYVDTILNLCKTILKPKIAQRYHVHENMESLHKFVPKEILPKEYGGEQKSMYEMNDEWRQLLLEFSPTIEKINSARVNERLREGKPPNDEFFGYQGNFRQLDYF